MTTEWWFALGGGMLIGTGALLLLLFAGRIAGISGIFTAALQHPGAWRWCFLSGLVIGAGALFWLGILPIPVIQGSAPWLGLAGFCVGLGTRLSNGCTSGHGICGIGRFSKRSFAATATFMLSGIITVALLNALQGFA